MRLRTVVSVSDVEMVTSLAERCWRHHYTPIIGKAQVDYMLANFQSTPAILGQIKKGRNYSLIEDGSAIGYLAIDLSDHLFLNKLYILPDHQRRGIGRWFLEQLTQAQPEHEIHLTVNRHNYETIAFYERMGFFKSETVVTDIGNGFVMDDWKMIRPCA